MTISAALTIAGSDPSGGAGIQADLKTFHQKEVYGAAAITLLTVQNTRGVTRVEVLSPDLVREQIRAVISDIPVSAAKTGALGNAAVIEAVAECAAEFSFPLVVDPVLVSKHGAPLLEDAARRTLIEKLFPRACLVTPNLEEARLLSGIPYAGRKTVEEMAAAILKTGARAVLVKGGHLPDEKSADDFLLTGEAGLWLKAVRIPTKHTHGTGCTYSAAITAGLARGSGLIEAVKSAKAYIASAIESSPGIGGGTGPVNHWARGR